MNELEIRLYRERDETAIVQLWRDCGLIVPWNNPHADIERKRADSPTLFFVGCVDAEIVASCMAGYDGHRGWIYYLAVSHSWRRRGFANKMVRHAEACLRDLGCPKIDLMVRNDNDSAIDFYHSIGYDNDPVVVLSKRLLEDEGHDLA